MDEVRASAKRQPLFPLDGYRAFINEMVELVEEMPAILRYAPGNVDLGSIPLVIAADDRLIKRIEKQLRAARKG